MQLIKKSQTYSSKVGTHFHLGRHDKLKLFDRNRCNIPINFKWRNNFGHGYL